MTGRAFASAGLFALVFDGLRRQGIAPPVPSPPGLRYAAPTVPLGAKRDLLSAIMRAHGPLPLLRVGEAIADQGFQPMLHALLRARGPQDLVTRWLRLERYAHTHHRTAVDRLDGQGARLRHVSLSGAPPSAAEDLLVLGVYLGLLRAIGCHGVAARVGGQVVARGDGGWDSRGLALAVAAAATAEWDIAWSGWTMRRDVVAPCPPHDPAGAPAISFDGCAEAVSLARLLGEDPARHLPLAEVAAALGLSPRALQRRLAASGLTLTAVLRTVQVRHACALLAGGEEPLPAVGYICGFSDQAHFTREFRKRVNMTPGAYRGLLHAPRDRPGGAA
ncbi:helix-turn-helix transcriptional regulator [Falsiroseomonas sp. E2-1-a20]|uniref:helix-turn-helix transcriptional regulator n=1 Tax=Falsiroseomonas sp. E2-1-a20 TaxID=3239300 RepID=UPI003F389C35